MCEDDAHCQQLTDNMPNTLATVKSMRESDNMMYTECWARL